MVLMPRVRVQSIPGWSGYFVSSCGAVFGPKKRLKSTGDGKYYRIVLCDRGKRKTVLVHHLVMSAFGTESPAPGMQIDHKNGNGVDNRIENLEWVTPKENSIRRSRRLGGNPNARKWDLPCKDCGVRPRRPIGNRFSSECRECHSAKESARYNSNRVAA